MTSEAPLLGFDKEPDRQDEVCAQCGRTYRLIKSFVTRGGDAHAIAITALHRHDNQSEAWIDVILGTFGENSSDDHITFGCRVGPVVGQAEPAATLVTAAIPYADSPVWGRKLSREEALVHLRLSDCWEVVDFLLVSEPETRTHVYGPAQPEGGPGR
jgi:hypothetical protein